MPPLTGHRVVPVKIERADLGGDAADASPYDAPSPSEPGEDILIARGFAPQPASTPNNASATLDYGVSCDALGNLTLCDPNTGEKTLADLVSPPGSGITESQHRDLDQLVHLIAEDSFTEYVFTGDQLDAINTWTDSLKTTKIRTVDFTYSGGQISTITTKQYNGAGVLVRTMTETFSFTGDALDDVTRAVV